MTYRTSATRDEPPARTVVVRPYAAGRVAVLVGAVLAGAAALLAAGAGGHDAVVALIVPGAIVIAGGGHLATKRVELTMQGDVVTMTWRAPLGLTRRRQVSRRDVVAVELQTKPPVESNDPSLPPVGAPATPPTRIVVRLATGEPIPLTAFFTGSLAANQRAVHDIEQLLGPAPPMA